MRLRILILGPALLLFIAGALNGCGGPDEVGRVVETAEVEPGSVEAANRQEPGPRSYTVRAVVRQLPDPKDPSRQILLHHAPIPNYVNSEGYRTGMPSMTMPFSPAPDVDLSGLAEGDPVEITCRVDWNATPAMQLTAIHALSPEEAP